jgi:hypothetical protein
MNRFCVSVLAAAALGLGDAPAVSAQPSLETRVTIALSNVAPAKLFQFVQTAMLPGVELAVDPTLQRPVSITLEDVRLRTLLDASCDSIGCRWRIDGTRLTIESVPPDPSRGRTWIPAKGPVMPAGSQYTNTPVASVLEAIGAALGNGSTYEVEGVDPSRRVTVDISTLDALRAIGQVVKATGLKPGSPFTLTIRRKGENATVIKASVPNER